jgi:hypothetical protein
MSGIGSQSPEFPAVGHAALQARPSADGEDDEAIRSLPVGGDVPAGLSSGPQLDLPSRQRCTPGLAEPS